MLGITFRRIRGFRHIWADILADTTATTATEYALIASLIAVAASTAIVSLGEEVGTTYDTVNTELATANG